MKKRMCFVLALCMLASGGAATASAAEDDKTILVPYTDFTASPDLSGWSGTGSVTDCLHITQNGGYGMTSYKYIFPDGSGISDLTAPYKLVMKCRMSVSDTSSFADSVAEAGFAKSQASSSLLRLARLVTEGKNTSASEGGATGTYNAFMHFNNGKSEGGFICDNTLETSAGEWTDVITVIDVPEDYTDAGGAAVTYYVNGIPYSTDTDGSPLTVYNLTAADGFRLAAQLCPKLNVQNPSRLFNAAFASAGAYAVNENPEFTVEDTSSYSMGVRDNITLEFSNEPGTVLDGLVYINGEPVESGRLQLGNDMTTLTILPPDDGYENGTELTVSLEGVTDIFGTPLEAEPTAHLPEIQMAQRIQIVPYTDFSSLPGGWTNVDSAFTVDGAAWKKVSAGNSSAMYKMYYLYPDEAKQYIQDTTAAYSFLFKCRMATLGITADDTFNNDTAIGFASGGTNSSSKLRLLRVKASSADTVDIQPFNPPTGTSANTAASTGVGEWSDIIGVGSIDGNGTGTLTYYINGVKQQPMNISNMQDTDQFRLHLQGASEYTGAFDDVEMYLLTPGETIFSLEAVTNAVGDETEFNPNDSIYLRFSNEIYKDALKDCVTVNGETVPENRLVVDADQKTLKLLPPSGGYEPHSELEIAVNGARDVFGNGLSVSADAVIAGDEVSVYGGGFSADMIGSEDITASFYLKNLSENTVPASVILLQCEGTEKDYKIIGRAVSSFNAAPGEKLPISCTIRPAAAENSFIKAFVWNTNTFDALLDAPLTLE